MPRQVPNAVGRRGATGISCRREPAGRPPGRGPPSHAVASWPVRGCAGGRSRPFSSSLRIGSPPRAALLRAPRPGRSWACFRAVESRGSGCCLGPSPSAAQPRPSPPRARPLLPWDALRWRRGRGRFGWESPASRPARAVGPGGRGPPPSALHCARARWGERPPLPAVRAGGSAAPAGLALPQAGRAHLTWGAPRPRGAPRLTPPVELRRNRPPDATVWEPAARRPRSIAPGGRMVCRCAARTRGLRPAAWDAYPVDLAEVVHACCGCGDAPPKTALPVAVRRRLCLEHVGAVPRFAQLLERLRPRGRLFCLPPLLPSRPTVVAVSRGARLGWVPVCLLRAAFPGRADRGHPSLIPAAAGRRARGRRWPPAGTEQPPGCAGRFLHVAGPRWACGCPSPRVRAPSAFARWPLLSLFCRCEASVCVAGDAAGLAPRDGSSAAAGGEAPQTEGPPCLGGPWQVLLQIATGSSTRKTMMNWNSSKTQSWRGRPAASGLRLPGVWLRWGRSLRPGRGAPPATPPPALGCASGGQRRRVPSARPRFGSAPLAARLRLCAGGGQPRTPAGWPSSGRPRPGCCSLRRRSAGWPAMPPAPLLLVSCLERTVRGWCRTRPRTGGGRRLAASPALPRRVRRARSPPGGRSPALP
jgi:hypothetical protein